MQIACSLVVTDKLTEIVSEDKVPDGEPLEITGGVVSVGIVDGLVVALTEVDFVDSFPEES